MISLSEEKVDFGSIEELFNAQKKQVSIARKEPFATRKDRLKKLRSWIIANRQGIQQALFDDFRKPAVEVDATEVYPVLNEISHTLSNLERWAKPRKIDAPITMLGTRSLIQYEPRGVCLIIAPWNYPFNLCMGPLVSALAAGNCIILKPSEVTHHTSALVKRLVGECFDQKVVGVCEGDAEVSQKLLCLPFDHVFFTGSPSIGKLVMKAASEHLTSVTLELGGKSPAIITPSAKIKEAAQRVAVAKFINNGQTCIAPDYVLVHQSVADEFNRRCIEQTKLLFGEEGKPFHESPHYARIVSDKHFTRITNVINDAVERGATVLSGGQFDAATRFIHPVVISNVPEEARVMHEEIFGPVLPVLTYATMDDALHLINSKPKPLALYIFSSDKQEHKRVLEETSSGGVCINDCAIHFLHHNLPFGGVNNSGIGKSHGYYGFLAFSNEKSVLMQKNGITSFQPFYPPYTKTVKKLMDLLLKMI